MEWLILLAFVVGDVIVYRAYRRARSQRNDAANLHSYLTFSWVQHSAGGTGDGDKLTSADVFDRLIGVLEQSGFTVELSQLAKAHSAIASQGKHRFRISLGPVEERRGEWLVVVDKAGKLGPEPPDDVVEARRLLKIMNDYVSSMAGAANLLWHKREDFEVPPGARTS